MDEDDDALNGKVLRVKSWQEFKHLILKHNPSSIAYNIEQGIPSRNLRGLRLILPVEGKQYVFIDTAAGNFLRKTGIPLHEDQLGSFYIRDADVGEFIRSETGRKDLKLHSYWTI